MKHPPRARPPILERRKLKRAAADAERRRRKDKEDARALRELARRHLLVNPVNLRPDNSYGTPEFVRRGYYVDMPFVCKGCGAAQVWAATQQKWWYESAKGDVWSVAVLCKPCRRREQARKAAARQGHLAGSAAKGKAAA
ncbi:MAG: zinc-ribbon domain containing protein [Rubrivivax sp.]|nr:zinc-ribbon domain containing protein [Rubrivivax sp.]